MILRMSVVLFITVGTILSLDYYYNELVDHLYEASDNLSLQSFYLGCTMAEGEDCQALTQEFLDGKL